jgi:hypothetical protein
MPASPLRILGKHVVDFSPSQSRVDSETFQLILGFQARWTMLSFATGETSPGSAPRQGSDTITDG